MGTAVAQWLRCCVTNRKVAGSIPSGVSGFFIDIKSFRSHYGPGVDSASNRNEYREYFLGLVLKVDNLRPSCAVVTKSGNLNFLEPFGPVQACNGTTVLYFTLLYLHTSGPCREANDNSPNVPSCNIVTTMTELSRVLR